MIEVEISTSSREWLHFLFFVRPIRLHSVNLVVTGSGQASQYKYTRMLSVEFCIIGPVKYQVADNYLKEGAEVLTT
jgi:hypothetical protein